MADISGYGLSTLLRASSTFPNGVTLTEFADDSDPFDVPSIQVADKAMGINGDLVTWSTANPIDINISVIPNGPDDESLQILLERNRPGRGKTPAQDIITLSRTLPDGKLITLDNGKLTNGPPSVSVASAGRLKSNTYSFTFENRSGDA